MVAFRSARQHSFRVAKGEDHSGMGAPRPQSEGRPWFSRRSFVLLDFKPEPNMKKYRSKAVFYLLCIAIPVQLLATSTGAEEPLAPAGDRSRLELTVARATDFLRITGQSEDGSY